MATKIRWNKVTWYSKLAAIILFVLVFGLGLYLGAVYDQAVHFSFNGSSDDMAAAGWKSHRNSLPLAPTVSATTTPKAVTKEPKNKPLPKTSTPASSPAAPAPSHTQTTQTQTPSAPATTVQPPVTPPVTQPAANPPTPVASGSEKKFSAYITAYTYWDNTPPGSSDISNPIIHQKAGGTGTFSDPITVAVGHDMSSGKDVLDYAAGTKFYLPYLKKYFIVEDTCGDGNKPENGPCHTGYQGNPWIDLWIDGASGTRAASNTCAENITEIHTVIQSPASNYAVVSGPVYNNGCATQFSDTAATQ